MANRWGNNRNSDRFYFLGLQNHCREWLHKILSSWKKGYDKPRQHIKKKRHYFAKKVHLVKPMFFPVVMYMWQLDHKEGWASKNWCFWTATLENILDLDCKIKPVNPKGNQSWIFKWKDWCWSWSSNTLATWFKDLTHWKRPWCWERLKVEGKGDDGGWHG